ncbi:hypothetical protein ACWKWC_12080 [Geodermatophilus nigrescens]
MTQPSNKLHAVEVPPATPSGAGPRRLRSRPSRSLPTERMRVEAQRRVLEAFAKLSGPDGRFVTSENVGQAVKDVSHHALPLSNAFFVDAGWLIKQGRGAYAATDALINWRRRAAMNPDDPRAKQALRETMTDAWFWQPIKNQINFGGADEDEVLQILMLEAGATPEHAAQLRNLLEWVEWVGLIRRVEDRVLLVDDGQEAPPPSPADEGGTRNPVDPKAEEPSGKELAERPVDSSPPQAPLPERPRAASVVSFAFSFDMTADDLAKLSPDQIQTLFAAVGNVMSIRAQVGQ